MIIRTRFRIFLISWEVGFCTVYGTASSWVERLVREKMGLLGFRPSSSPPSPIAFLVPFAILGLILNSLVVSCNGGSTSRFVRKLESTKDMPPESDVFKVPHGYNAPQQVSLSDLSSFSYSSAFNFMFWLGANEETVSHSNDYLISSCSVFCGGLTNQSGVFSWVHFRLICALSFLICNIFHSKKQRKACVYVRGFIYLAND